MACTTYCAQINLQKSRVPGAQLSKHSEQIVFVTEPPCVGKKVEMLINNSNSIVLAQEGPHLPRAALDQYGMLIDKGNV